jgi:hypothetical protein
MNLETALEHAIDGNAILFTGSAFSEGAINLRNARFKRGRQLASYLSKKCKLPEGTHLEDAAEEYLAKFGEDALIEELQQEYTVKEVGNAQLQIAKIPWKRIYTTNYDNIMEVSFNKTSKRLTPVTMSDDIRSIPKNDPLCIHFNGFIDRLTRETLESEIKLTESSYLTADIVASQWAVLFRQDINTARSIFFVGYSLYDLDIKRILFQSKNLKEKCFFILGPRPDDQTVRRASLFGEVLKIETDKFGNLVERKLNSYKPPQFPELEGYCIEKYALPPITDEISDKDIFDLLLYGNFKPNLIWASMQNRKRYFLQRDAVDEALRNFEEGKRAVVINSDIGNGKTLVLEGIKCKAIEKRFEVFSVVRRTEDLLTEMEKILRRGNETIIIVEDYPNWLDVIEYFSIHASKKFHLLLSGRSGVHDVMIDQLYNIVQTDSIPEITVDHFKQHELEQVINLFDEYGIWGKQAAYSKGRKAKFLATNCKSEMNSILLSVLESPHIISRFKQILEQLNEKRDYYEVVITVLILAVLNYPVAIDTLVDIWGQRILDLHFRRNSTIRELFDFNRDGIRLRSATVAHFILNRVANINLTVDVLVQMARTVDKISGVVRYQGVLRSLMQFSNLQYLLPERGKRPAIISYYERIKDLGGCKRHPLFWLQYAIACLVLEELERADKYFKTAYSFAEQIKYDTYQIDNHYARYLLVKSIKSKDLTSCMADFRMVRKIINEQIKKERLHYPYRVASLYLDFYETFKGELSDEEKKEIGRAADFVVNRIKQLPEKRRQQKYVLECQNAMNNIIDSASDEK